MEFIQYLKQQEGKTLEFKENCRSLPKIIQTVAAFANTAGGTLIIGVRDKTHEVIGLSDPLEEEERLSNGFADGIRPLMIPDIQINSEDIDFRAASEFFASVSRQMTVYFESLSSSSNGEPD